MTMTLGGIVVTVLILTVITSSYAGQRCLSCLHVEGGDACHNFVTCNDDEVCFMHNYSTDSGNVIYDYGCGLTQVCHHFVGPIVVGRRSDGIHAKCTVCCNDTSLCNQALNCNNVGPTTSHLPRECSDVKKDTPIAVSGVYTIYPYGTIQQPVKVFCKFDANGLAWTIIQRRYNGHVDFYRNWQAYKTGFGSPNGEYWLGNDIIHQLTSNANHELRIEMSDFEGVSKYAEYTLFHIGDEDNGYRLTVYNFSGTAGDGLNQCQSNNNANGMQFSTFDKDNDQNSGDSCAVVFKGAWWYNNCLCANLNGKYLAGHHDTDADGMIWAPWHLFHYSLKHSDMMIRKY